MKLGAALAAAVGLLLVLLLLGLGPGRASPAPVGGRPLRVVATTTHIAEFASQVGGERVSVSSILHAGDDPHEYQPTAADARAIADADVVLRHGLGLDRWVDDLIEAAGTTAVYTATWDVPLRPGDAESPEGDPHVWQDPRLAKAMVANVAAALAERDPANADQYAAGADRYGQQLDRLDRDLATMIAQIPPENRKMVTNHDAFHYYCDRYGLDFVGSIIPSTSTEEGVPAGSLERLIKLILDRHVKAVFSESAVSTRVADEIASRTGARVVTGLLGDSLGEPGSGRESYEAAMRANTSVIVDALK